MTSVGCRSGVHWMREKVAPSTLPAIARGEHRLRRSGHVLEQHVPAADECGEDELDLLRLAANDRLDVREQQRRQLGCRRVAAVFARRAHSPTPRICHVTINAVQAARNTPYGSVWTITSATSGRARRSRSSTSLARACASASVEPGSRPSVRKATTPFSVRSSRSSRGSPPAARATASSISAAVDLLARVDLRERLEMRLHRADLGDGAHDLALDLLRDLVRLLEREVARQLQVERELRVPVERDDAEVVDLPHARHAQRRGVGALAQRRVALPRLDVDDDVDPRQRALERLLDPVGRRVSLADRGAR